MKKILFTVPSLFLLVLPLVASAHEHDVYMIGKSHYQFVVGSLNEPLVVDDKSGLDLTINKCFTSACMPSMGPDGDMDGPAGSPIANLENSLKVELIAGEQKKSFDLSPQWGKLGSYKTTFYPTVATSFSYHITGTLESTPIDLTFSCVPEGTPTVADDTTELKISDVVTRLSHGGAFGCPQAKAALGFPEQAPSILSLSSSIENTKGIGEMGLALGAAALALSVVAFVRRRRS